MSSLTRMKVEKYFLISLSIRGFASSESKMILSPCSAILGIFLTRSIPTALETPKCLASFAIRKSEHRRVMSRSPNALIMVHALLNLSSPVRCPVCT